MPIYQYRCRCGHIWDHRQVTFDPKDERACPECGEAGQRLIVSPAVKFKGKGFYVNDSKGPVTKQAEDEEAD